MSWVVDHTTGALRTGTFASRNVNVESKCGSIAPEDDRSVAERQSNRPTNPRQHSETISFRSGVEFFSGVVLRTSREPVLVSSGTDNCIKMWVFDSPDGTARLLRSREGHSAPPRAIRYYGNTTLATMGEGAGEYLSAESVFVSCRASR